MFTRTTAKLLLSAGVVLAIGITGCNNHRRAASSHSLGPVPDYGIPHSEFEPSAADEYPDVLYNSEPVPLPDDTLENTVPPAPEVAPPDSVSGPSARLSPSFSNRFAARQSRPNTSVEVGRFPLREDNFEGDTFAEDTISEPPALQRKLMPRPKLPPRLFRPIGVRMRHMLKSVRKTFGGRRATLSSRQEPKFASRVSEARPEDGPNIERRPIPITTQTTTPDLADTLPNRFDLRRPPATLMPPRFAEAIDRPIVKGREARSVDTPLSRLESMESWAGHTWAIQPRRESRRTSRDSDPNRGLLDNGPSLFSP